LAAVIDEAVGAPAPESDNGQHGVIISLTPKMKMRRSFSIPCPLVFRSNCCITMAATEIISWLAK
jgi:hypothetical protein